MEPRSSEQNEFSPAPSFPAIERPLGVSALPRAFSTKEWPLRARRSKAVQIGIDLDTWEPYIMLIGETTKFGKREFLRLTREEAELVMNKTYAKELAVGFSPQKRMAPFEYGGLTVGWIQMSRTNRILLLERKTSTGKVIQSFVLSEASFNHLVDIRELIGYVYDKKKRYTAPVRTLFMSLYTQAAQFFYMRDIDTSKMDTAQSSDCHRLAVEVMPTPQISFGASLLSVWKVKMLIAELLTYHEEHLKKNTADLMKDLDGMEKLSGGTTWC
jgi:hypothetical protein